MSRNVMSCRSQCYVRGAGGNVYTLKIPGPGSYVDCGTERVSTILLFMYIHHIYILAVPAVTIYWTISVLFKTMSGF